MRALLPIMKRIKLTIEDLVSVVKMNNLNAPDKRFTVRTLAALLDRSRGAVRIVVRAAEWAQVIERAERERDAQTYKLVDQAERKHKAVMAEVLGKLATQLGGTVVGDRIVLDLVEAQVLVGRLGVVKLPKLPRSKR